MKQTTVNLLEMQKKGKLDVEMKDGMLNLSTHVQNTRFYASEMPICTYLQAPQRFKLPLRIDIRAKLDAPSLFVILGQGHVSFGPSFLDNRRIGDILAPDVKKVTAFNSTLEMGVVHDISVVYSSKFMLVLVDGECSQCDHL